MDRIVIMGCDGSGKTHVARRIAALSNLPRSAHFSGIYYDREWSAPPLGDLAALERVIAEGRWLIAGDYDDTLRLRLFVADTVLFLDLPAIICLVGVMQRRWRYRRGQSPADGLHYRTTWTFLRSVLLYRKSQAPRVRSLLAECSPSARVITLTSRRQIRRFLSGLRADVYT